MNGPEHYREAERLLGAYSDGLALLTPEAMEKMTTAELSTVSGINAAALTAAQVHATLALVAATAEPWIDDISDATGNQVHRDWWEAIA